MTEAVPIEVYPGCPPLSYVLASRVTSPYEEADCFVIVQGRKGKGKSTLSLALCEDTAEIIAYLRGKGEDPKQFFNINHVTTIDKEGAIRLLTSGILKKKNAVVLLDDVSVQWNSRNFMSWVNKALNDIIMIARVYQCVVVCNAVSAKYIDSVARDTTDYRIRILRKNTNTKQTIFRCLYYEIGEEGKEYRHHLTWHGMRIRQWVGGLPSEELMTGYKAMRQAMTDQHVDGTYTKVKEKLDGVVREKKPKAGSEEYYRKHPQVVENYESVKTLKNQGKRTSVISRETGLPRYWVEKIIAMKGAPK